MAKKEDLNKPLTKKELEELQKKLKGKGGSPGQIFKKANLADDLKINPLKHKGAQRGQKIYNKAKQGEGTEKDWLKKTGPQLPLAKNKKRKPRKSRIT